MEGKKMPCLSAGRKILISECATSVNADGNHMRIGFVITGNGMKPSEFDGVFRAIEELCSDLSRESQDHRALHE